MVSVLEHFSNDSVGFDGDREGFLLHQMYLMEQQLRKIRIEFGLWEKNPWSKASLKGKLISANEKILEEASDNHKSLERKFNQER